VIINFLIIAFVVYMLVKFANATKKKEAPSAFVAPKGPNQEELLIGIRDA
jgi:large conductance mechanosensitive channel